MDFGKLITDLQRLNDSAEDGMNKLLDDVSEEYADSVRDYTPVDTGELKRSIDVDYISQHTRLVGSDADYAPYVEHGHATRNGGFVEGAHMFEKGMHQLENRFMDDAVEEFFRSLNWGDY